MKVICDTHGELDELHFSGYGLGHNSAVNASELDLEGVMFVLDIPENRDKIKSDDISTEDKINEKHLSKFDDIYEQVANAINTIVYNNQISIEARCPSDPSNSRLNDCQIELSE